MEYLSNVWMLRPEEEVGINNLVLDTWASAMKKVIGKKGGGMSGNVAWDDSETVTIL